MTRDELIRMTAHIRTNTNLNVLALSMVPSSLHNSFDPNDDGARVNIESAIGDLEHAVEHLNMAITQMGGRA